LCRRAVLAELRLGGGGAFGTVVAAAGVGSLIGIVSARQVGGFRRRGLIQQIAVTLASLPSSIDLPAFKRGLSPMSWVPEYAFMRPLRLSVQCHRNPL
jgi:hypothetical protein